MRAPIPAPDLELMRSAYDATRKLLLRDVVSRGGILAIHGKAKDFRSVIALTLMTGQPSGVPHVRLAGFNSREPKP